MAFTGSNINDASSGLTVTYEYQLDGTGSTWISAGTATSPIVSASKSFTLNLVALGDGFHTMYFRARNSNGNSVISSFQFAKTSATVSCPNGYTFVNIVAPSNGYVINYVGSGSFHNGSNVTYSSAIGHFRGYRGNWCYSTAPGPGASPSTYTYSSATDSWSYANINSPGLIYNYTWVQATTPPLLYSVTASNSGYVNVSNSGSFAISINGITDPDPSQTLTHSYQWDGTGSTWTNISTTSSPVSEGTHTFGLNLS